MPPYERLRHLARWTGGDDATLATEAADLLGEFADDPAGLVVACRQLLAHHPASGPLWWLTARILSSPHPWAAALDSSRVLRGDATAARLAERLPFPADDPVAVAGWPPVVGAALDERPDLDVVVVRTPGSVDAELSRRLRSSSAAVRVLPVEQAVAASPSHLLVEVRAAGRDRAVVASGTSAALDALVPSGARTWLVVPTGRALPERLLDALVAAVGTGNDGPAERAGVEVVDPAVAERVATPRGLVDPGELATLVDCPVAPELLRPL